MTVGCTTMQQVEPQAVPAALARLEVGDRVSVRTADSWQEFSVVAAGDSSVRLEGRDGKSLALGREDRPEIRLRKRAPGRTIALALGLYLGSLALLCGNPFDGHEGC
jgi:hypothetical protein